VCRWVELPVEGFFEDLASPVSLLDKPFRLVRVRCERLLEEDVLASLERLVCPLKVLSVGNRDIDYVDLRVGEKIVVRTVGFLEVVALGILLS